MATSLMQIVNKQGKLNTKNKQLAMQTHSNDNLLEPHFWFIFEFFVALHGEKQSKFRFVVFVVICIFCICRTLFVCVSNHFVSIV